MMKSLIPDMCRINQLSHVVAEVASSKFLKDLLDFHTSDEKLYFQSVPMSVNN